MAADPQDDEQDTLAWLDGLAGRGGDSAAAREGAQVRRAIVAANADVSPPPPPWPELVRRAEATGRTAANDGWAWRAAASLAAVAVLGGTGLWWQQRGETEADRGDRGASTTASRWYTQDPAAAAGRLAQALNAGGARVTVEAAGNGSRLSITCGDLSCAQAADALLAPIEAGLGPDHRLTLDVLPPR